MPHLVHRLVIILSTLYELLPTLLCCCRGNQSRHCLLACWRYLIQWRSYIGANWSSCSGQTPKDHFFKSCKSGEKIFRGWGGGRRALKASVGGRVLALTARPHYTVSIHCIEGSWPIHHLFMPPERAMIQPTLSRCAAPRNRQMICQLPHQPWFVVTMG